MPPSAAPTSSPPAPDSTASNVFEALVADIVSGRYPAGTRLPAERELAKQLGASRPTLREALRRLSAWNMVAARRGSGIVVRDAREWMIEALPSYLRYARPDSVPRVIDVIRDILMLRRLTMIDLVRMLEGRMPEGGTRSARLHVARAWDKRADAQAFAEEDFQVVRALAEAAGSLPAMWMVNRISGVYLDIVSTLAGALQPPDEYRTAYGELLDLIDSGNVDRAAQTLDAYLHRHDERLVAMLEQFA